MKTINLLVAAGGTGGHLFPALAVVDALSKNSDITLNAIFVGNAKRIEGRVIPGLGYKFIDMPMIGLQGKFSLRNFQIPFRTLKSLSICKSIIRENEIGCVLCTGAYLSYPAGIAASMLNKPLVLMESNVIPGKSIKALSSKSSMVITSFEESSEHIKKGPSTVVKNLGNPVRSELLDLPDRVSAAVKFGLPSDKRTFLVFGGSLGAKSINQSIDKFIKSGKADDLVILWQTGANYKPEARETDSIRILPFIDDMASAYALADLVVSRSGATTMAELAVAGKPSILVPFPLAANNHQEFNADIFNKHGAGIKIKDNQLWDKIEFIIPEILGNQEKLRSMSESATELAKPEAANNAADEILKLC
jgi:UDP-N-acetylglucosamine--N-acetylmuramyl-(pentapeptide) pyrophosphoryl-undecaprenol N-acetylglucosamine transferase